MKKLAILVMSLLIIIPSLTFANREHHQSEGGHEGFSLEDKYFGKVHFLFQNKNELGLTEEQMEQIKNIKFDVKRAMIDAEAKKELAMLDIYQELYKDQPDVDKIDSLIDQKSTVKAGLSKTIVRSLLNTKAILTAEQQAKAKELYWKN